MDELLSEFARDNSRTPHPLLHRDFLLPALEHFGDGVTKILAGRQADRLVLLAPVAPARPGYWRSFSPSQLPIAPLVVAPDCKRLSNLARATCAAGSSSMFFDVLHHDEQFLPAADPAATFDATPYCMTMMIDATQSFDEYWAGRPKKLRSNLKRYMKRAESSGLQTTFIEHSAPEDVAAAFARYARIESSGWKGAQGTAIAIDNDQGKFYSDVLNRFAATGQARIFELVMDGKVASSRIGIQDGTIVVFLKTTYDEEFKNLSPGRLLLYKTIERTLADPTVSSLEFYTNASADQAQWASETRPVRHLTFYRWRGLQQAMKVYRWLRSLASGTRS